MIKNILPKKSGNPETLKKTAESSSTNVLMFGENLLRVFYKLFYLQFCDSRDQ